MIVELEVVITLVYNKDVNLRIWKKKAKSNSFSGRTGFFCN